MLFNAVVLRDIPKEEAILDLLQHQIQGGFRGFYSVVPAIGWHYVSVKDGEHHVGRWFNWGLQDAVVFRFEPGQGLVDVEPGEAQQYQEMALSGAMAGAMMEYPPQLYARWFGLTRFIPGGEELPEVHAEDEGEGSRFIKAWKGTHGGDNESFMAEFQTAFLRALVSQYTAEPDEVADARWRHLLLACYNAGEFGIKEAGTLFKDLVDVLLVQFPLLPDDYFESGSFVVAQVKYMIEDMKDSGVAELEEPAQQLAAYLKKRKP